jgi:hypothetical protein
LLRLINLFLLIFIIISFGYRESNASKKHHFAVGIIMGPNSQILSYSMITTLNDKIIGSQPMTEQRFMYYMLGNWPCVANPKRENLLEKNGIDSCFLTMSYANKINGYYAKPFNDLWRVRYKIHPTSYDAPAGWSNEYYKPSQKQSKYINDTYGVPNVKTSVFYGDSLYKILRDIQNPDWVTLYSNL